MKEQTDSKSEPGNNPRGGKQFFKKKGSRGSTREETTMRENFSKK